MWKSIASVVPVAAFLALGGPVSRNPACSALDGTEQEVFTGPRSGIRYGAHRDDATGEKWLEAPDGRRYASTAEVVEDEERSVEGYRRVLAPALWDIAEDPDDAADPVTVVVLFRSQPAHEIGAEARRRHGPALEAAQARARAVLDRIDPLLPERERRSEMTLRELMEEERAALTGAERAELEAVRAEVQAILATLREEVLSMAAPAAAADRATVAAWCDRTPGARFLASSVALSTATVTAPAGALRGLCEELPGIARVAPVVRREAALDTSAKTIGADSWWLGGFNGSSSTRVAVLDSGMDATHPALSGAVAGAKVFHDYAQYAADYYDVPTDPDDYQGHGTHVAGIVGSRDAAYAGVLYGGDVLNAKCGYCDVYYGTGFYDPDVFRAGDWAVSNGASVLNCSFGGGGGNGSDDASLFFDAVVFSLSTPVVTAAGNAGTSPVIAPADAFNVLTVGNFDDWDTVTHTDNFLHSSSNRGPTTDGRRKPDLAAPGEYIMSCNTFWKTQADFVENSGTSMAAPHVAAACGLLLDFSATWSPEGLKALLLTTPRNTTPYPAAPDNAWGWGGLDLAAAYACRASVREGTVPASGPPMVFLRLPSLAASDRVTLVWNRHIPSSGASAPTTYWSLTDLDLSVYDEAGGALVGSSMSSVNPVEQVKVPTAVAAPVVKVRRNGAFPAGVAAEPFAVASETTSSTAIVSPPQPVCAFTTLAGTTTPDTVVTVSVTVTNGGQLASKGGTVTLGVPGGYVLQSGANPAALPDLAAGAGAVATWTVRTSADPGRYDFTASAETSGFGEAFQGATRTASQEIPVDPPAAPTGLVATTVSSTRIDLAWTDESATETGYQVERKPAGGAFAQVATAAAGATAYASTNLAPDTAYVFRVRATNYGGPSPYSNEAGAATTATLDVSVLKGQVVDSPKPGKDKVKVVCSYAFNADSQDDQVDIVFDALDLLVGDAADPFVLTIPARDAGWVEKGGSATKLPRLVWKSPPTSPLRATVVLDRNARTLALTASRFDFAGPVENDVRVRLGMGNDSGTSSATWRESGNTKFKYRP